MTATVTSPRASELPTLDRELLLSGVLRSSVDFSVPDARLLDLPETIVQFGTGMFLRGFVEFFIDEANCAGRFAGRIVAVTSTESARDLKIGKQDGLFTLLTQGVEHGTARREYRIITALSRALSAAHQWEDVLVLARSPQIELVFSNTTEAGITLDLQDMPDAAPPRSYPGKLTRFLYERARAFDYADDRGVVILPCELIEQNGDRLRDMVLALAHQWQLGDPFVAWVHRAVPFCNTLVDRIVTGASRSENLQGYWQELGYRDELLTSCESYRLFAIEGDDSLRARLAFAECHDDVVVVNNIGPYRERKVRLLNGAHSILAATAILAGCDTVHDAVADRQLGAFLRGLLFDELVPSMDVPDAAAFARQVLDRFGNPFLHHMLNDLTLQLTMKLRMRVVPTVVLYAATTGCVPRRIAFGFAAYLLLLRPDVRKELTLRGVRLLQDDLAERVASHWTTANGDVTLQERIKLAHELCADWQLWQADLLEVPGFADAVAESLVRIERDGVRAALAATAAATLADPVRP